MMSLLGLILFHPILDALPEPWSDRLGSSLTVAVMLAGVWWAAEERRHWWPALLLVLPAIGTFWFRDELSPFVALTWTAFCVYTISIVFLAVMQAHQTFLDRVFAAISVYLLVGMTYSYLYMMILRLDSGSFSFPRQVPLDPTTDMLYFSFVTILTLGFGDIVPLSPFARMLTITEALTGTFFIAILIARLISTRGEVIAKK